MTKSRSTASDAPHQSKKTRLDPEVKQPLDIHSYPHILDAVIDAADSNVLRALRATSREMRSLVDQRDRHLTLEQMAETPQKESEDDYDTWDSDSEDGNTTPAKPVWAVTKSGVRFSSLPDATDVLDINGPVGSLWYDIVHSNLGLDSDSDDWSDSESEDSAYAALNASLFGPSPWVPQWVQRNGRLFYPDRWPRLVRYPDGFDDNRRALGPLKPDPCAVYFCEFSDFILGLYHLDRHYSERGGVRESFLDTVFNVDLVEDILGEKLWETINPMFEYDLHLESNAYTVLFNTSPEFVKPIQDQWEHPPFFVGLLMVMTRNFIESDEGKATIVGYDTWPVNMLPDPNERDGRGPSTTSADRVRRWIAIHVADAKRKLQEEGEPYSRPETDLDDPIRLLTLEEWRKEIGEEYYKLMTDRYYQYESAKPLPQFKRHPSVEPLDLE